MSATEQCKTGKTFKNWAETIEFKPKFYCHPMNAAAAPDTDIQANIVP